MEDKDDFAKLLESSLSGTTSMEPGQLIEAEIVAVSGDCIFLQLDGKSEGQLDAEEMTDENRKLTVKEGDKIKAYFVSAKNGVMHFTTRISGDKAGKSALETAFKSGIPVEGTVEKEIKGGFEIKIGDIRAFCPYSQIGLKRVEDSKEYLGNQLTFKILEYSENGRNILVSNRAILKEEHQKKVEVLKKKLHKDMKVKGIIKSIQDYGAFVDIGGVEALLPISEISRSRVEDIQQILTTGQEIEAVVIKLDWKTERISLSIKELLPDPWDKAQSRYKPGSQHTGTIVRLTNFGAFVSLEPGLDGLIHISDLDSDNRIDHPRDVVKNGQSLKIEINNIDIAKKRISLKPVSDFQEDESLKQYMGSNSETYSPFGDLLKGRK